MTTTRPSDHDSTEAMLEQARALRWSSLRLHLLAQDLHDEARRLERDAVTGETTPPAPGCCSSPSAAA